MRLSRIRSARLVAGLAAVAMIGAAGLAGAPAASATPTAIPGPAYIIVKDGGASAVGAGACATAGSAEVVGSTSSGTTAGAPVGSISASAGQTITVYNWCPAALTGYWNGSTSAGNVGAPVGSTPNDATITVPAGVTSLVFKNGATAVTIAIAVTVIVTPSGGDSAESSAPAAMPAALTLGVTGGADGTTCKEGSAATGYTGQWLTLPGSGDCTQTANPKATLLGWSTSPTFPVAIAQRQATNKWGTYELTDADGNIVAVFIPAGWGTFVSGSNSLYPIWAS